MAIRRLMFRSSAVRVSNVSACMNLIPTIQTRTMSGAAGTFATEKLSSHVREALWKAQAVCFDVDSTVVTVEGIDEFAAHVGKKEEVAALTKKAMGGSVPFHEALEARLSIINPTAASLNKFLSEHPFHFTPGVQEVIGLLQARGTAVYLVSGGFTQMINPVAEKLGIPRSQVYANTILFDSAGKYAGFDRTAPTSRDGGKTEVMKRLKASHGYTPLVMVGDGATDLQARPPADLMLGYGGIVTREVVAKGSDWFVRDFSHVVALLKEGQAQGIGPAPRARVMQGGAGLARGLATSRPSSAPAPAPGAAKVKAHKKSIDIE